MVDMNDETLLRLARRDPMLVPTGLLPRALRLAGLSDRHRLVASLPRRRPRHPHERRVLLSLALEHRLIELADRCGAFETRPV